MKPFQNIFAVFLFTSASASALAAPATPEEAGRLTGVFQAYLGEEPGVVTVTPTGESYDVKSIFRRSSPNSSSPIFRRKLRRSSCI